MIETVDRNNLNSLLINNGQNKVGPNLKDFASKIDKITTIDDLVYLYKLFKSNIMQDTENKVLKFVRTSEEIFKDKLWSGCSDIGTALAPILRLKGIPTIYVQSAHINWIKDVKENNVKAKHIIGHIFLELYLNNNWILFDPTNGYLYQNYNFNNRCLPHGYYIFSKSLNGHEIGCNSLKNNNDIMKDFFLNNDIEEYEDPHCKEISLDNYNK